MLARPRTRSFSNMVCRPEPRLKNKTSKSRLAVEYSSMAAADSPIDLDNDELPPLALKINPFEVEFFKTRLTSNPVVEDTKSGGFVINLGHRPGFRVGRTARTAQPLPWWPWA